MGTVLGPVIIVNIHPFYKIGVIIQEVICSMRQVQTNGDQNPAPEIKSPNGIIKGEPQRDTSPRGSGRVVRYDYWKKLGLQYPLGYGFESYIVYKALVDCFNVRVIRNAISWSQRPTGKTTNYRNYGKAMRSLGYHPLYAMGRIALTLKHNPKNTVQMTLGYFDRNTKKYDIASKVCKFQSGEIKKKIKSIIRSKL